MEVSLGELHKICVRRDTSFLQSFRLEVTPKVTFASLGDDPEGVLRFESFREELKKTSGREKWWLQFGVQFENDNLVYIQVRSELLGDLQRMINQFFSGKGLKLEVTLQAFQDNWCFDKGAKKDWLCVMDVQAKNLQVINWIDPTEDYGQVAYFQKGIKNNGQAGEASGHYECQLRIIVDMDDRMNLMETVERSLQVVNRNREMLEKGTCADFEVVAKDNTRISCHKVFLAESPVLRKVVEFPNDLDKNEVYFPDMSPEALYGFLEFIYFGGIVKALESPGICLQLLEAGFKYKLPGLEETMGKIILEKGCAWWTGDEALEFNKFLKGFNGAKKGLLTQKTSEILQWQERELK